jgi:hypothetical protein
MYQPGVSSCYSSLHDTSADRSVNPFYLGETAAVGPVQTVRCRRSRADGPVQTVRCRRSLYRWATIEQIHGGHAIQQSRISLARQCG